MTRPKSNREEAVRAVIQGMWDIGLRASPTSRTVKEAGRFDPDNLEFTLATLDRRFLAGQFPLYQQLHQVTFPGLVLSEWSTITQKLGEIARARHAKVRQYHLSSGAEHQGLPRRVARLFAGGLVCDSVSSEGDEGVATAARRSLPERARRCRSRLRFSGCGAMFPALPPRARRQHARLAIAGRGRGAVDWPGDAWHGRPLLLDAHLLPARARRLPPRRAADGAPARAGQFLSPVPPPPHAHCRNRFPARPGTHRRAARSAVQRHGSDPARLLADGDARLHAFAGRRRSHYGRIAGAGDFDSRGAVSLERAARGAAGTARGARPAHHARPRHSGDADSGVPRHRCPGDPRQLPPLYRRRAHVPGHR